MLQPADILPLLVCGRKGRNMARSPPKPKASFNTTLLRSLALAEVQLTGDALRGDHYGSACKALWKGTTCTVKTLYMAPTANNLSATIERFEQECKLLSRVRHPNIVQFLGLVLNGEAAAPPALVLEHCPHSLSELVDAHRAIPIYLQVSVVRDVSQALAYLHCALHPPVVHGSITAANVLVSQALQAKLSDLGVARIVAMDGSKTLTSEAYLPPEVHSSKPRYSPAVDVFSLGNLMLHIATRCWPVPRESARGVKTAVVELERRRKYLDAMKEDHLLNKLVQECLHGDPDHRPKTMSVVNKLCEISEQVRPQFETLLDLMIGMERRESELLHTAEDLTKEREELQVVKNCLKERDIEATALKEHVKALEKAMAGQESVGRLIQPPPTCAKSSAEVHPGNEPISLKATQPVFVWKRDAPMPTGACYSTAVVLDGKLYIGGGETKEFSQDRLIYEYDFDGLVRKWTCLPVSPTVYFTITVFNKSLVLVGGADTASRRSSSQLLSWDKEAQEWSPSLPPMPTARQKPATVSHDLMLLVAGGYTNKRTLSVVEMLDSATFQWQAIKPLPIGCSSVSSCVVDNQWYLLGGKLYGDMGAQTTFLCLDLSKDITQSEWSVLPDSPLTSSCAVACEHLVLAVGGAPPGSNTPSKSIHVFLTSCMQWMFLCNMPTAHSFASAAVVAAGKLYVLGGKEELVRKVDYGSTVEMLAV